MSSPPTECWLSWRCRCGEELRLFHQDTAKQLQQTCPKCGKTFLLSYQIQEVSFSVWAKGVFR